MKLYFQLLIFILAALIWRIPETSARPGTQSFISPEVMKDKTVTFRFLAPNEKEVKLSTQFTNGLQTMTKNDNVVWNITLGSVKPHI